MAVSAQKFLDELSSVRLLSSDEVSTIREKLGQTHLKADAERLAKELVKAGKLTRYQAAAIYQGRGKGLVFGEYVVLDKLGAGGMGQVFKAQHRRMKRLAAIKILPPHLMKGPQFIQRFYQEVEVAAKLNHPNIVQAYDAAEAGGLHFLVMEYVDGQDLGSIVSKRGPMSVEQAMNCLRQVAEGLAYAHAQGVIHRDIKPANLLADRQGNVKILDMGLARTVDAFAQQDQQSAAGLTQEGEFMGTVDYMAPEQARDARGVDHRADLYSLGCTLYRLLTGELPYARDTTVKKLMAHAADPIPSLRKLRPETPIRLEQLYERMMAKDPDERVGSAQEIAATVKDLLSATSEDQSSISVLDDPQQSEDWQSFVQAAGSSASMKHKRHPPATPVEVAPRKNSWRIVAGGAVVLLLLLIGGWFVWRSRGAAASGEPQLVQAQAKDTEDANAFSSAFPDPPKTTAAPAKPPAQTAQTAPGTASPPAGTTNSKSSSPPSATASPVPWTVGKPIDLLPLIDLKRDVVAGSWEFPVPGMLRVNAQGKYSRLQLPSEVPANYSLTVLARRVSGSEGFVLGLVAEGQQAIAMIAATTGSGLAKIDGKASNLNETTVPASSSPRFPPGLPLEMRCVVLDQRIVVQVDGRTIIDWRGAPELLSLPDGYQIPNSKGIFVGTYSASAFEMTRLELTPLDSTSPPPAGLATANPPQVAKPPTTGPAPTAPPATITPPPAESGTNQALFFDGRTANVELKRLLPPESRVMTWEATIWTGKPFAHTGSAAGILGNLNVVGTAVAVVKDGIRLAMPRAIDGSRVNPQLLGATALPSGQRQRIAAVFDQQQWRIFVEGKLLDRLPISGTPVATPTYSFLRIGAVGTSGGVTLSPFHGAIDEVRISSIARYAEDYDPLDRLESDEHTLALYHFNEGTGTVLGDASGHGYHGQIFDAKWVPAPPADPRHVSPTGSNLALALAAVDKVFQADVLKARSPAEKASLAQRLLTEASDLSRTSDIQFAILQRTLELAVESSDRDLIKQSLAAHHDRFQGLAEDRLVDAIGAATKKQLPASVWQTLAAVTLNLWYRAYDRDQIALARRLASTASAVARKSADPALIKQAGELTKWLSASKGALDAAQVAQEKLASYRGDALAQLDLGRYLCFDKEDWLVGLPHLAKGSDPDLRGLSAQSLAAEDDVPKIVAAADAWYDASSKLTGKPKAQYQSAAYFWYLEAVNRLTGADRSRVETRLNQLGAKTRRISFTQARREREAAEWATASGGTVTLFTVDDGIEHGAKDPSQLPPGAFWIKKIEIGRVFSLREATRLAPLKQITSLLISGEGATMERGAYDLLGRMGSLTTLKLSAVDLTTQNLKSLSGLKGLSALEATYNPTLQDVGLQELAAFPALSVLNLQFTPGKSLVGDAGAMHLANLKNLTSLNLNQSTMTDVGLKQLQKLPKLASLSIVGTKVSPTGVQQFKSALPKCTVSR